MHKMVDGVEVALTPEEITERNAMVSAWVADEPLRLATLHRRKRNDLLSEADWIVIKGIEQNLQDNLGVQFPVVWLDYRQALRDITNHANWPNLDDADWPTKPS